MASIHLYKTERMYTCAFSIISAHLNLNIKYIQDDKALQVRMQI